MGCPANLGTRCAARPPGPRRNSDAKANINNELRALLPFGQRTVRIPRRSWGSQNRFWSGLDLWRGLGQPRSSEDWKSTWLIVPRGFLLGGSNAPVLPRCPHPNGRSCTSCHLAVAPEGDQVSCGIWRKNQEGQWRQGGATLKEGERA